MLEQSNLQTLRTNMLAGIWDQNGCPVVGLKKEMDRKVDDNGGESEKNNTCKSDVYKNNLDIHRNIDQTLVYESTYVILNVECVDPLQ